MKVYIGFDEREAEACLVARKSLLEVTNGDLMPEFLDVRKLQAQGLFTRPVDHRGQDYDLVSNAPQSTRFAVSRFLVPILCQQGYALFVDGDVVFLEDPRKMRRFVRPWDAVAVVKHDHRPFDMYKMVNQKQTVYPRKNWSSVMLFNCDHEAHRRLSLHDVNNRPGRDLHAFYWLHDDEISELEPEWNWLVGEQPVPPPGRGIAHFTRGGPWLPGWVPAEHDDIWLKAAGK